MSTINLGLIGCGGIGNVHGECVAKISQARFIAYADIHEESAQSFLDKFGGEYATADADKLLADDHIDAVYICTRHDSHAPLAIAAARAGKHIMIEKPLALTETECEAVAEEVAKAGVVLMPAFKLRFFPLIRKAREFLPQPRVVAGQVMDSRWPDGYWAQEPEQGGANVHSQGCHATDIIRYLSGSEPARVWAAGGALSHPGHPCIDQCAASILFANGNVGSWINGDAAVSRFASKFFFQLYGDGKSVEIHDRMKKAVFSDGENTWTEERAEEEGMMLENVEFIAALREGRQPCVTALDGLQATRIVLAADRAIRTGEVQTL